MQLQNPNLYDAIEAEVSTLEELRKKDPNLFYSRPGRGGGEGHKLTVKFLGRMRGWVDRLEKVKQ